MNESVNIAGEVEVLLNGVVVVKKKNLVVRAGSSLLASAILTGSGFTPFSAIAIGTGTTAPTVTDTTLQTEIYRAAYTTSSVSTNVVNLSVILGAGVGVGLITEAGIFNNTTSGGTMFSRVLFGPVNKDSVDILTINWTLTVGS